MSNANANPNTEQLTAQDYQSLISKQIADQTEHISKGTLPPDQIRVRATLFVNLIVTYCEQTLIQESEQRVLDAVRAERTDAIKRERAVEHARKREMQDLEDRYVQLLREIYHIVV